MCYFTTRKHLCRLWYARESIQNSGSYSFLQHKLSRDFIHGGRCSETDIRPWLLLQYNVKYPTPSYIDRSSEAKCVRCKSQMFITDLHNIVGGQYIIGAPDMSMWDNGMHLAGIICVVPNYLNPNLFYDQESTGEY